MEFCQMEKYRNSTGIYKIRNTATNEVYVGQSTDRFIRRFWNHRWLLRDGSHFNTPLQKAWNLYGEESFSFEIIEEITDKNMDEAELQYIKYYRDSGLCYNISDGGHELNLVQYRRKESRKKVGELNRQRMTGQKLSAETRAKMAASHIGKHTARRTDVINKDIAFKIKKMLIDGRGTGEIMEALNIPYKPINAILSNNTWSSVYVDGWDAFQKTRKRGKGVSVSGTRTKHKK